MCRWNHIPMMLWPFGLLGPRLVLYRSSCEVLMPHSPKELQWWPYLIVLLHTSTLLLKLWWTPCNTEWLSTVCLGIWVRLCPLWKYQEMFNIFTLLYIFHYCFWLVQYKILQHNFRVVALAISVFLTVLCSYTILWSSKVQRP